MSLINLRDRTINAKIVFYGTALSGKTTSLKHVHNVFDPTHRTELVSLNTEGDRTLFFDFLPIPLGTLNGFEVKLQAFTVPGQVKYNLTRRYVLRGADGVIFVADSRPKAFRDNIASLESLWENLKANKIDADEVPLIIQYNKRDVPDAVEIARLREALNGRAFPEVETVAVTGKGVFGGFAKLCCEMVSRMASEYRFADPERVREVLAMRMRALEDIERAAPARDAEPAHSSGMFRHPDENPAQSAIISVSGTPGDDDETPELEDLLERAVETNMESARLLAELHETRRNLADHVRELAALHETGLVISSELDEVRLMRRILSSTLATVGTGHGSVLLTQEKDGRLGQALVRGYEKDPLASGGDPDPAFVERVLGRRAFALRAPQDAALLTGGRGGPDPQSALVAPLAVKGNVLGALVAYLMDPLD
jgi:signal recognition particle receptor subunit beta